MAADAVPWLPDDQLHVVETLAYVNDLIARAGDIHFDHLERGAFEVRDVNSDGMISLTLTAVPPLPIALSRITADILNQLRGALEHVLLVEVARAEFRQLSDPEEAALEVPASTTPEKFVQWAQHGRRRTLASLHPGRELNRRLEALMSYQRRDPEQHPLRLLVRYTNSFKHRAPAVAATRIARVNAENSDPRFAPNVSGGAEPARVGDVIGTAPVGIPIPLSIWPTISLRRPSDGTWRVLMYELRDLERWVRRVAVPTIVTGEVQDDVIRPGIDTNLPQTNIRQAASEAPELTASDLDARRMKARTARIGLEEVAAASNARVEAATCWAWVTHLDDDDVLRWLDELESAVGDLDGLRLFQRRVSEAIDGYASDR